MAKGRGTLCTLKPRSRISAVELLDLFNPTCIFIFFSIDFPHSFLHLSFGPLTCSPSQKLLVAHCLGICRRNFSISHLIIDLTFELAAQPGVKLTLKAVGRFIAVYHQVLGWNVWAFAISRQLKLLNIKTNMFSPAPSPSRPSPPPPCSRRKSEEHGSSLSLGRPWFPPFGSLISTWRALYPRSHQEHT